MSGLLRRLAVTALALPLLVGTATAADAGTKVSIKSSGDYATVSWSETRELEDGSTQFVWGNLDARGSKNVSVNGNIEVITCPAESESGDDCTFEFRYLENDGPAGLTMNSKTGAARLTGSVMIYSDLGAETASVDITWTGSGPQYRTRETFTYTDETGVRFTIRSTNTGRQAEVSGFVGDVNLDGDEVYGSFGSYREMLRDVTP